MRAVINNLYFAGVLGKIYIGVINNTVQGIRISRDDKDRLRQGVDETMKGKIEPMVHFDQYDIIFHAIEGGLYVMGKPLCFACHHNFTNNKCEIALGWICYLIAQSVL